MKLKNSFIYQKALDFQELEDNYNLSVIVNFFLQRNIEEIMEKARSIGKSREFIIKKYGFNIDENNEQYQIKPEYLDQASKELEELGDIEQEVNITKIKLSQIKDNSISNKFLKTILFMIEDDLSETKEDK